MSDSWTTIDDFGFITKEMFNYLIGGNMSVKFLKVKLKSLAEESRIIRLEEHRTRDHKLREALYLHRVLDVRKETRSTHIAYGYLRGKSLKQIEQKSDTPFNVKRVKEMIKKYGTLEQLAKFDSWIEI